MLISSKSAKYKNKESYEMLIGYFVWQILGFLQYWGRYKSYISFEA